ncbi:MAG: hypothetical protein LC776_13910, partial [Acidobacteria bacterium]|nr:hypothetical protein [Acidobacteriota bacterium]
YGDPNPWSGQKNGLFTFFSFINLEKYPPSLLFLLVTLGPAIAALALFDRTQEPGALVRALIVFGRVPLFYYILHLFLIHVLRDVFVYIKYNHWEPLPGDTGYGLPIVYLVWFAVVLVLYPACRWFAGIKKHRRDAWLSYF